MAEEVKKAEKSKISVWWAGLKDEFRKIIWPTGESLAKQTVAVIVVSVILGFIIALLDAVLQYGVNFLVNI